MHRFLIGTALIALLSFGPANANTFLFTDYDVEPGETDFFRITVTESAVPGLDSLLGSFTYDLYALNGDEPDTIISLLTDDGARTLIAENDDGIGLASSLNLFLDPGTYLLTVGGFSNFYPFETPDSNATGYSLAVFNDVGAAEYLYSEFAVVPLPAAGWLFGAAVLGLVGIGRRRTQVGNA